MKNLKIMLILFALLTLSGCSQKESFNNTSGDVTEVNSANDENEMLNGSDDVTNFKIKEKEILSDTGTATDLKEVAGKDDPEDHTSCLIELKLNTENIETLEFNKQYLLTSDKKICSLELKTQGVSNQPSVIEIIIDEKPYEILHSYDVLEAAMCYIDLNGEYRVMLSGKRGNDYDLIEIYKITVSGIEKESQIIGKIKEILDDGKIGVESRQFLIGFQTLTAIYKISDDGQIRPEEDFEIGKDTFLLVNDIEAEIYSADISNYKKTTITAGERLTFYKTNMKDKLYFERDNREQGYIEMKVNDTNEGFSVNGINLEDYFDGSELSWAG